MNSSLFHFSPGDSPSSHYLPFMMPFECCYSTQVGSSRIFGGPATGAGPSPQGGDFSMWNIPKKAVWIGIPIGNSPLGPISNFIISVEINYGLNWNFCSDLPAPHAA